MESDWRFAQDSMANSLKYMLEKGEISDCCFLVGSRADNQQMFAAHKFMLRIASPVFETMFFGSLAEDCNAPIEIIDIEKEAFELLLKFIYFVDFDFKSIDLAKQVYAAADKYLMEHLKMKCVQFLESAINATNVLNVFGFTQVFDEPELRIKAFEIFKASTSQVLHPNNFASLDISTFSIILDLSPLNICDEMELFKLIEGYAFYRLSKENVDNADGFSDLMNNFRVLVRKIRFRTMGPTDFANGPALSKLLTLEESKGIHECLIDPINGRYPREFTTVSSNRCANLCGSRLYCESCERFVSCRNVQN